MDTPGEAVSEERMKKRRDQVRDEEETGIGKEEKQRKGASSKW